MEKLANSETEPAKENTNSIEQDKTLKQLESCNKRVEKGRIEESDHLTRRVQREKDLQQKEARTPRHRPPSRALCSNYSHAAGVTACAVCQ